MDYTGTTTRLDLIDELLPYIQTNIFSYLDNTPLSILLSRMSFINAPPPHGARGVERGADLRGCSSSSPLLTSVNLSQPPSPTGDVDLSTPASNMVLAHVADAYATPPPPSPRALVATLYNFSLRPPGSPNHRFVTASFPARGFQPLAPTSYPATAESCHQCPLGPSRLPPNRRPPHYCVHKPCTRRTPSAPHAARPPV